MLQSPATPSSLNPPPTPRRQYRAKSHPARKIAIPTNRAALSPEKPCAARGIRPAACPKPPGTDSLLRMPSGEQFCSFGGELPRIHCARGALRHSVFQIFQFALKLGDFLRLVIGRQRLLPPRQRLLPHLLSALRLARLGVNVPQVPENGGIAAVMRSEEHTSELQS